ncbi:MAG TPA: DUF4031 domain-containing protein [Actinomycetales bacterium]|nr:DUF4031 domain-containing protein [Actinomycetales bacterium]
MPLLIDEPRWPAHGRLWSHLVSDTSFAELHAFADALGLPPRSFEGDHYDVPAERYEAVLAAGARPVSIRQLVVALHASGLRRPKRKGERVLASTFVPDVGPGRGVRRDLLASILPAPVTPAEVNVLVFGATATTTRPSLLVVHAPTSDASWSLPGTRLTSADDVMHAAAAAVSQQTGVRLNPRTLRISGHTRILGTAQTWLTYLTTTVATAPLSADALWAPTDVGLGGSSDAPWWPLVGWIVDRRQPRT